MLKYLARFLGIGEGLGKIQTKADPNYLNIENFELIRDSSFTDECCELWIGKSEDKLVFSREPKGYTLFFLVRNRAPEESVQLVGLDGYGLRDKYFLKIVCKLVDEIRLQEEVAKV